MLPFWARIDTRRVRYPVVREALERFQRPQVNDDPTALVVWWDGFIANDLFMQFPTYQRINKIPGMDIICYKTTFFQALERIHDSFPSFYGFFATTYQLPFQFSDFQKEHIRLSAGGSTLTWIMKPRGGCCGNGIRLIQNSFDVAEQRESAIIQKYIPPFLIDGYKFDFRFYVLISSLAPVTAYIYDEGLARFCSQQYSAPTRDTLVNRFSHLTNTAVNVSNQELQRPILELASSVLATISTMHEKGKTLWNRIKQVSALSIIAIWPNIIQHLAEFAPPIRRDTESTKANEADMLPTRHLNEFQRYFHILGIDILVNDNCDPIVLELNDRPSMCVTYDIERTLKSRVVFDALNALTVDGREMDIPGKLGGWQKLLPGNDGTAFGKALNIIFQKAGQRSSAPGKPATASRISVKKSPVPVEKTPGGAGLPRLRKSQ
jgi:hypothetical protein